MARFEQTLQQGVWRGAFAFQEAKVIQNSLKTTSFLKKMTAFL